MEDIIRIIKNHQVSIERNRKVYAVLLPLIWLDNTWQIVYEVRSQYISSPGQTSFPGGGVETGETAKIAATRETVEELGIKESDIEIIGQLDPIIDQERIIYCFVGQLTLSHLKDLSLNTDEVERVFTIPIQDLINQPPMYHSIQYTPQVNANFPFQTIGLSNSQQLKGFNTKVPVYSTQESLWGLTARLTDQFISLLKESH